MQKFLIFIAGIIAGILITLLNLPFFAALSFTDPLPEESVVPDRFDGITIFAEPGDCISKKQFEVFRVLKPGAALAREESYRYGESASYRGMIVLFMNDEGKYYYDEEIIKIPSGKCIRQIGVYKYSNIGEDKTVPVVKIME